MIKNQYKELEAIDMKNNKKLRVVHYPQVPCDAFLVEVNSLSEAKK